MTIEKSYQISYDLNHQNQVIINAFRNRQTLPTILKKIVQNNPAVDELIILAHILNVAKDNLVYFSKSQIRYCLNQFYNRDYHGDKQSYLAFLYSLQVNIQNLNSAISKAKRAVLRAEKKKCLTEPIKTLNSFHKASSPAKCGGSTPESKSGMSCEDSGDSKKSEARDSESLPLNNPKLNEGDNNGIK